MKTYAFRLQRGQELKKELQQFVAKNKLHAAFIVAAVGSLDSATLRMAGATPEKEDIRTFEEKLEVVSLVGTIAKDALHLHIALSRKNGEVIGGHLKEAVVDTTMEVVVGNVDGVEFTRKIDTITGFKELHVVQKKV